MWRAYRWRSIVACRAMPMTRVPEMLRAREVHLLTERDLQAHSLQQASECDFVNVRHVTQHWLAKLAQTSTPPPARDASPANVAQAEANDEEMLVKRVRCAERGEPSFAAAFDASLNFSYKALSRIVACDCCVSIRTSVHSYLNYSTSVVRILKFCMQILVVFARRCSTPASCSSSRRCTRTTRLPLTARDVEARTSARCTRSPRLGTCTTSSSPPHLATCALLRPQRPSRPRRSHSPLAALQPQLQPQPQPKSPRQPRARVKLEPARVRPRVVQPARPRAPPLSLLRLRLHRRRSRKRTLTRTLMLSRTRRACRRRLHQPVAVRRRPTESRRVNEKHRSLGATCTGCCSRF